MLEIKNLHAKVGTSEILRGIDLKVVASGAFRTAGRCRGDVFEAPYGAGDSVIKRTVEG